MSTKISILQTLLLLFYRFVFRRRSQNPKPKYQKYPSNLLQQTDLSRHTLIFNVEGALLKSESLFPYFMLVAFESGGLIRSFLLFILYPLIYMMKEEMGLNLMVMICFFGLKRESFRAGKAVLPKFFLEDVGLGIFEVLRRGRKRIGVSDLPQVMIEGFLKDYLEIDGGVVGREMKVVCGYFIGIMEDKKRYHVSFDKVIQQESITKLGDDHDHGHIIGITSFNKPLDHYLSSYCKEIYMVRNSEKRSWETLPRSKYPRPLVFHDGRLALKPTPLATLSIFMWISFALFLAFLRILLALTLPYDLSIPLLAFSGIRVTTTANNLTTSSSSSETQSKNKKGVLYACNHRTLFDPLCVSFILRKKNLTAVTYSLSRVSEMLAPIRTVRLSRDHGRDREMMDKLLNQGDLVVCPEGTTCREPYLLRFSPLFTEISNDITPMALDTHMAFFYGTTASGLKALDLLFFLMDPIPSYTVQILRPVSGLSSSSSSSSSMIHDHDHDGMSKFEVANHVQSEIGKALGFECTSLTRKHKYLILAGNNGLIN